MNNKILEKRIFLFIGFLGIILSFFALRLFYLQVVMGEQYLATANRSFVYETTLPAARGDILDRNGEVLVDNRMGINISLNYNFFPTDTNERNEILIELIDVLNESGDKQNDPSYITYQGGVFEFVQGSESYIASLKDYLGLQEYATAENVFDALVLRFDLEDYSINDALGISAIRYGMVNRGFSSAVAYTVAVDVSMDTVVKIKERSESFLGVDVLEEAIRNYPNGSLLAHTLGVIGPIYDREELTALNIGSGDYDLADMVGKFGIESAFEGQLRGEDGTEMLERNNKGVIIDSGVTGEAVAGNDVYLTIDIHLQDILERSLPYWIEDTKALDLEYEGADVKGGSAVVLDVKTGETLAIASYPTFDLQYYYSDYGSYATDPLTPLSNRATSGLYSPGSSFKPIVAAAALDAGVVSPYETIHCGGVYTYFQPFTMSCMHTHGNINVYDALKVSCNVYFYEAARRLGISEIVTTSNELGLATGTGIEIPEAIGKISSPDVKDPWYPADVIQAAIGQGDTLVTPLQLAVYTAALANDGVALETTLVNKITTFSGETVYSHTPTVASEASISAEVLKIVEDGMVDASGLGGTAANSFLGYPIEVASKTGTPQNPPNSPHGVFIAYAPADDPEIAIAIVIENGGHGYYYTKTAREIFDYYFFGTTAEYLYPEIYPQVDEEGNVITGEVVDINE